MTERSPKGRLLDAVRAALKHEPPQPAMVQAVLQDPEVRAVLDQPLNLLGDAAIHLATEHLNGLTVLDVLLNAGAHPDVAQDNLMGSSALSLCLAGRRLGRTLPPPSHLVRLLGAGARWDLPNHEGRSAMDLAMEGGHDWAVTLFVDREAAQLRDAARLDPLATSGMAGPRGARARL